MTLTITGPTSADPVEELLQKLEDRNVVEDVALRAYELQKHEDGQRFRRMAKAGETSTKGRDSRDV